MVEPAYSVKNLRRRFGQRDVLDIQALDFEQGHIYGLLGPNGSGKTTLMRLLSFMDTPTSGEIRFFGKTVEPAQAAKFRAQVVWAPQTPVMFTGSLLYNVEYPMRLKGMRSRDRRSRATALLRDVGLEHLAHAPARHLSGGEAQRGSIARALAAGAKVILFDEPTASVDYRSRQELIDLIARIHKERQLTIMVATHDLFLAKELCEKTVTLFDGIPSPTSSALQ